MGETIHPQVEHVPVIDDTLADLARFGAVPLQGSIAHAAIFRRLAFRQATFRDIAGQRHVLGGFYLGTVASFVPGAIGGAALSPAGEFSVASASNWANRDTSPAAARATGL